MPINCNQPNVYQCVKSWRGISYYFFEHRVSRNIAYSAATDRLARLQVAAWRGTAKCENSAIICENAAKCERQSTLNVKVPLNVKNLR